MIQWRSLDSEHLLESIIEESHFTPQIIFKHSTTCPISSMAKRRLEGDWSLDIKPYYLDLLAYRPISNAIAQKLNVVHESPQVLLIINGKAVFDESHLDISTASISQSLDQHVNG